LVKEFCQFSNGPKHIRLDDYIDVRYEVLESKTLSNMIAFTEVEPHVEPLINIRLKNRYLHCVRNFVNFLTGPKYIRLDDYIYEVLESKTLNNMISFSEVESECDHFNGMYL
jgi:hypothetical protein